VGSRLDKYKKRTSVDTNRKAIELLKEIGITLHASFMVDPGLLGPGLPGP